MAFSLDRKCPRLIDFFYNLAKLVSRASFAVPATPCHGLICQTCKRKRADDKIRRLQPFSETAVRISLEGRLRNTSLSPKDGLMAVKEAVVNSIQSITEACRENGRVSVCIHRIKNLELDGVASAGRSPIDHVTITDNGEGFNQKNFEAFNCLDFSHKKDAFGCKGMGRLMWLKAFESATIDSTYQEGDELRYRRFVFTPVDDGVKELEIGPETEVLPTTGSRITLNSFKAQYEKASPTEFEDICNDLLAHCIQYFVVESPVEVVVREEDGKKELPLVQHLKANIISKHENEKIKVGNEEFTVTCLLVSSSFLPESKIYWCANERVAKLSNKPFSKHQIFECTLPEGQSLLCVVQSDYLDRNVRPERDDFTIPKSKDLSQKQERTIDLGPSFDEIIEGVWTVVEVFLHDQIETAKRENAERVEQAFQQYPQFGPLRKYSSSIVIPNKASNNEKKKILRSEYVKIEEKVDSELDKARKGLNPNSKNYRKKIEKYVQTILSEPFVAAKQVELASYVARRKAVLDCFERALEIKDDGKYELEATLHSLIVPMRIYSGHVLLEDANLWLLDDRLAFHNYLASDLPLKDYKVVSGLDDEEDRPDLAVFKDYWNEAPENALDSTTPMVASNGGNGDSGALSVVEFKRPNRTDWQCIDQALDYVNRLKGKDGTGIKSFKGRPVKTSNLVQVYVVLDISNKFEDELIDEDYRKVSEGYLYKPFIKRGAVVNVCSWDYLLNSAKERNKMFFKQLGIDS